MVMDYTAFQEPRGVMRILHFVFSICAFATITDYMGIVSFANSTYQIEFTYPYNIYSEVNLTNCTASIKNDFSSDARFFVATGVLAMLYALGIMLVYLKMDEIYKTNKNYPLYDFLATVFLAVLWLSSSAAWAHALTGLKSVTSHPTFKPSSVTNKCTEIVVTTSSYSQLNISVIFGFLNFFLWAADLWFLYKETAWFQGNAPPTTSGV
ncbi:hypothetical protein ABEB36_011063 [Hypothenemus hampei]|uniref:MARVEL domain-containing protein n=1 Tax=Hypothenemus hampei TaxID=57062 RepID=A0ABD1EEA2_HYPHA